MVKFHSRFVSSQKKNVSLIGHVLDLSVLLISLFYLSLQVCISVLLVIFGYFHKNIEPGK